MTFRPILALALAAVLAACGADGEPEPPLADPEPAVRISGDVALGVSVGDSGVRPHASVGTRRGPVTVRVGF